LSHYNPEICNVKQFLLLVTLRTIKERNWDTYTRNRMERSLEDLNLGENPKLRIEQRKRGRKVNNRNRPD
ncbi:MAG: hypothetical protein AABW99_04390, partial [archaeon]